MKDLRCFLHNFSSLFKDLATSGLQFKGKTWGEGQDLFALSVTELFDWTELTAGRFLRTKIKKKGKCIN